MRDRPLRVGFWVSLLLLPWAVPRLPKRTSSSGFANGSIQLAAGWRSDRMVVLYGRELAVRYGAMAQWFRGRTTPAPARLS